MVLSTLTYHTTYILLFEKSTMSLRKNHTEVIIKSNSDKDFGGNNAQWIRKTFSFKLFNRAT